MKLCIFDLMEHALKALQCHFISLWLLLTDCFTIAHILMLLCHIITVQILQCCRWDSVAAVSCEVAVCEAQCVVGSVIRPVDHSLPPTYTHSEVCGHTAGPVWPTAPTSPLPLPGWDDREREQGGKREEGGPSTGHSPDVACLSVWMECAVHTVEGCVYVS